MSILNEFKKAQEELLKLQEKMEVLAPQAQEFTSLIDLIKEEAQKQNISLSDIADALDPQRTKKAGVAEKAERKQHKPRAQKVYKNPETQEVIITKGGNHNQLKEWKTKYGAEVVESWRDAEAEAGMAAE